MADFMVFGSLFVAFLILLLGCALITVGLTYDSLMGLVGGAQSHRAPMVANREVMAYPDLRWLFPDERMQEAGEAPLEFDRSWILTDEAGQPGQEALAVGRA